MLQLFIQIQDEIPGCSLFPRHSFIQLSEDKNEPFNPDVHKNVCGVEKKLVTSSFVLFTYSILYKLILEILV